MRKPIQILITPATPDNHECLYAVCNDGSIWVIAWSDISGKWMTWERLPNVPQENEEYDTI